MRTDWPVLCRRPVGEVGELPGCRKGSQSRSLASCTVRGIVGIGRLEILRSGRVGTRQTAVGSGCTVTFDGRSLIIRAAHLTETKIPVSDITMIGFGHTLTGGYIDFLSPGACTRVEFGRRQRTQFGALRDAVTQAAREARARPEAEGRKDVDPAALLIAVIVVAAGPLLETGPWDKLNTIVAVIVLVVVVAYSLTRPIRRSMSMLERVAVSLVIGLICGVAVSWPVQQWVVLPHWPAATGDDSADRASDIGQGAGLLIAAVVWAWLWPKGARSAPGSNAAGTEPKTPLRRRKARLSHGSPRR
jgi:hypothetical protein